MTVGPLVVAWCVHNTLFKHGKVLHLFVELLVGTNGRAAFEVTDMHREARLFPINGCNQCAIWWIGFLSDAIRMITESNE
jgi:hypothetical protein